MFTIQSNQSFLANATVPNVLSGNQFEFIPYDAHIEVLGSMSATGLSYSMYANNELLFSNALPNIKAANNPAYPDDLILAFDAAAGTRLVLSVTNSTGGALTGAYIVRGSNL